MIILPRQARDKHRESTQKRRPFSQATLQNATQLRHARPLWRGGKTGSAKSGLVALTAVDVSSGDATLNLFGAETRRLFFARCDLPHACPEPVLLKSIVFERFKLWRSNNGPPFL
jgi:hypothetical protein